MATFPRSAEPFSDWMVWRALASILHALTSSIQADLNRLPKKQITQNLTWQSIRPALELARELTQKHDNHLAREPWKHYKATAIAIFRLRLQDPENGVGGAPASQ